ncbi:MAG: VOC family protein [Planctomycetes bacterium]|nr:VOC family protein [Planctomycetota bacterium]
MNKPSAVAFQGSSRIHVALEVRDLVRSIEFYSTLLGVPPAKLRPGYAKFEPEIPSVNLTLNEGPGGRLGRLGGAQHFGVQVQSTDAVQAMVARFRAAGLATRVEEETACCYAVQTKVWVEDPDGNPWEVFVVTEADAPARASADSACCVPAPAGEACCVPDPEAKSCCNR